MSREHLRHLFPFASPDFLERNADAILARSDAEEQSAARGASTGILERKKGVSGAHQITFSIEIVPRSVQFGKRMGINRKTGKMIMYCDKKTKKFYDDITKGAARFVPESPLEGPLMVEMTMYFPRPKKLLTKNSPAGPIWMPCRPDAENLFKGVADPLTKLGFWKDDAQIVDQRCQKMYCHRDLAPEIVIHIEQISV